MLLDLLVMGSNLLISFIFSHQTTFKADKSRKFDISGSLLISLGLSVSNDEAQPILDKYSKVSVSTLVRLKQISKEQRRPES